MTRKRKTGAYKQDRDKLTEQITLWVTESQYQQITKAAHLSNKVLAKFVREAALIAVEEV